ncbi:hypothetical protein FB45DRAFT_111192 [Roridomyces roridus]|uniref:Uncharacterized protein n=1 Tax=Roridomyces roridus TaxID=1738132 RepID=A0AAD7FJI7_9AGAR|nr:hypothetical protein FB45DRAFT_111192 [Roridomyces roridus]
MAESNNPSADDGASRAELLQALRDARLENERLNAEIAELHDERALAPKKKRGKTKEEREEREEPNRMGYKAHVLGWAKRFLSTRALFVDKSMFCARPNPPSDPFESGEAYAQSVTIALYEEIPKSFHELLDTSKYQGLAKALVSEHSSARSVLITSIRGLICSMLPEVASEVNVLLAATADRSNNPVLEALLKFHDEQKLTPFAPVLFPGFKKDMTKLFLGPAVLKVHRLMYFGPKGLTGKPAGNANGLKICLKSVTASSIAQAATLLRFVLSPDTEWSSTGAISKINWEADYRSYVRMLTVNGNMDHVKKIFKVFQDFVFSGIKAGDGVGLNDDAGLNDGMEAEIAEAMHQFELGDSGVDP